MDGRGRPGREGLLGEQARLSESDLVLDEGARSATSGGFFGPRKNSGKIKVRTLDLGWTSPSLTIRLDLGLFLMDVRSSSYAMTVLRPVHRP